jgi:hypothetical protein
MYTCIVFRTDESIGVMARRLDQRSPAGGLPDLSALAGHHVQIALQRTAPVTAESLWNGTAARTHDGSGKHETGSSARGQGCQIKSDGPAGPDGPPRQSAGVASPGSHRRLAVPGAAGRADISRTGRTRGAVLCRPRTSLAI